MKTTRHLPERGNQTPPPSFIPLPLDLETAPEYPAQPLGNRAYVGGVLYVEGFVFLLMGLVLLFSYWPPVKAYGHPPNPISRLGMWIVMTSVSYMVVVGVGIFLYNLWRPGGLHSSRSRATAEPAIALRARRYASMKKRTRYIFDCTICSERDADEAMAARDLY